MNAMPYTNGSSNGNGHASVVEVDLRTVYYGDFKAVRDTNLTIKKHTVTAFIGPSGCGKSTVLRSINRMNDLIRGFRFDGQIRFRGKDIYDANVDPVAVRFSSTIGSSTPAKLFGDNAGGVRHRTNNMAGA